MTEHSEDCAAVNPASWPGTGPPACDCGLAALLAELKLLRELWAADEDTIAKDAARAKAAATAAAHGSYEAASFEAALVADDAHSAAQKRRVGALAALDAWRNRAAPKAGT